MTLIHCKATAERAVPCIKCVVRQAASVQAQDARAPMKPEVKVCAGLSYVSRSSGKKPVATCLGAKYVWNTCQAAAWLRSQYHLRVDPAPTHGAQVSHQTIALRVPKSWEDVRVSVVILLETYRGAHTQRPLRSRQAARQASSLRPSLATPIGAGQCKNSEQQTQKTPLTLW